MADDGEEQLDFGDEGNEEEEEVEEEHLLGDDEAGNGASAEQDAEEDGLQGLDDVMHDADQPAPAEPSMPKQEQQEQHSGNAKQQQDGQDGKASKGPRVVDLTQRSNRLERFQQPRGQQQQQIQQQPKQQPQQQQQPPLKQQQPHRAPPNPRPIPSSRLRGAVRYFMLRSLNMDNWRLAQEEGAWATPLLNEQKFGAAFQEGREVVFFMAVQTAGAIQGYGRMTSLPGKAPQVSWKGIDYTRFNNFYVSWDCTAPIPFDKVRELQNPWSDPKLGALSKGPPAKLERHRDGQELAPQIGEQLIDAMNLHAAQTGRPASGLLAEGVPAARRRGAGVGPAAAGPGPAWQQQRQGMAGPQQQMHMQQQQQRMMAMQQQQMQQRGGMSGRGMMGGPVGPIGQQSRQVGPGGRMMQQQQPPPPGVRAANTAGLRAPGPGGPMGNDPRLNPRFAGRLKMDGFDDLPPANVRAAAPGRGGPQHSPPGYGRSGGQYDGRDGRYEREQDGDWEEGRRQQGQRHGSRGRRHSRSRSRSPPRAASSRGGSTGRAGGGAVAESSWGAGGSSPEQRRRQEEDEPESIQDMSYEQYLAAYERVQLRIKQLKQVAGGASTQQQPEPQLQLALLPGPPPGPAPQRQQMAGGGGGMGMRGAAGVRGGGMGGDGGGSMGGGMMAGGAANGDAMWPGTAAAAGGAMGPGRPADNPVANVISLPEYMRRIKSNLTAQGKPLPPDEAIIAKYHERLAAKGQQQQPQQQRAMAQQQMQMPQPHMGVNMGMNPMMAMNPMAGMNMMAATAMAAASMNPMMAMNPMAGMMGGMGGGGGMGMGPGQGMGAGMMGPGRGGGGHGAGPAGTSGRGQMPMEHMGGF